MTAEEKILNMIESRINMLNLYSGYSTEKNYEKRVDELKGMLKALNIISEKSYVIEVEDNNWALAIY